MGVRSVWYFCGHAVLSVLVLETAQTHHDDRWIGEEDARIGQNRCFDRFGYVNIFTRVLCTVFLVLRFRVGDVQELARSH